MLETTRRRLLGFEFSPHFQDGAPVNFPQLPQLFFPHFFVPMPPFRVSSVPRAGSVFPIRGLPLAVLFCLAGLGTSHSR